MRGELTKEVQEIAKKRIGREISLRELRLIPYIQYVMVNEQKLDMEKINQEEREILSIWKNENYIEGGASGLLINKEFWDFICEVLFQSYVKSEGGEI